MKTEAATRPPYSFAVLLNHIYLLTFGAVTFFPGDGTSLAVLRPSILTAGCDSHKWDSKRVGNGATT